MDQKGQIWITKSLSEQQKACAQNSGLELKEIALTKIQHLDFPKNLPEAEAWIFTSQNAVNNLSQTNFAGKVYASGKQTAKALKEFSQEVLKNIGGSFVEALSGNEGAIPLANKVFGRADNPFVEVFFNSMNVRTFQYNFNFAPRNEDETMDVQKIIQLFRFHMAPELKGANNRFLTLPSTFDIHYMYQMEDGKATENDFYNKIATCVLENCTVDYTPGGVRSFANGAPTQITMSLQFKETELLTKERINEGF